MSRASVLALSGVLCFLPLTACSEDTVATPSPTNQTSSRAAPSSTPAPTEPIEPDSSAMPALAEEASTAGAKAFVRYFVQLENEAWRGGSINDLKRLSAAECDVCERLTRFIERTRRAGGFQRGGDWSIRSLFSVPGQSETEPILNVQLTIDEGKFAGSSSAEPEKILSRRVRYDFYLTRSNTGWSITDIQA